MLKAIVIAPEKDNVATAVKPIAAGEEIKIEDMLIQVLEDVPFGHKFSIANIEKGGEVIKYAEVIGEATAEIKKGSYVHVHNVVSKRGRGDLKGADL